MRDVKIEIEWELGLRMRDGEYIVARDALFEICNELEEMGCVVDDLSDEELYFELVDYLKLPKICELKNIDENNLYDCEWLYDYCLGEVSGGFYMKRYRVRGTDIEVVV